MNESTQASDDKDAAANGENLQKFEEKNLRFLNYLCIDIPEDWSKVNLDLTLKKLGESLELETEKKKRRKEKVNNSQIEKRKKKIHSAKLRKKVCNGLENQKMEKILRRVPGFSFDFTNDQLKMLNNGNKRAIVIGRSGTGKSTCAVLRMLAIDLLYIAKKCLKEKKDRVEADDLKGKIFYFFILIY